MSDAPARACALQRAGELLWAAWQRGNALDDLPADCRPADADEGFQIQARLAAHSSHPLFGWKIAATSEAGQRHIGVGGPLAGRLLRERVVASGSTLSLAGNRMAVAEPEFAFLMARDLPPRSRPYEVREVTEAVATLHPALEVPNSRFIDFARAGEARLLADNACAHELVLAGAAPDAWRGQDLAAHGVLLERQRHAARLACSGSGRAVLGDPRHALAWLANHLQQHGLHLRAGEVVSTGACVAPISLEPGDTVRADFGALGSVVVRLSA
ncbi:2-keto-4-pentenoate hydratase [Pseudorhodoferax sp.]|uniref:2-keto-4-pentenoate hydratase n=1 Tax=Pseudorhodoferax sp. TaxID=1993553 RepID=UPI002DD61981|nr:fumarylacetoacetate hydrolase family protein [Pseudorhodoferax sp.]